MVAITDEQLAQRVKSARPILRAIAFAEGHVTELRAEMREQAAALPGSAAATALTIAQEYEILAKRHKHLADVLRRGY